MNSKVVLVTGGSRGLGQVFVERLLETWLHRGYVQPIEDSLYRAAEDRLRPAKSISLCHRRRDR